MDHQELDYYYGDESSQFSFYRIPRQLVTSECFYRLSTDAVTKTAPPLGGYKIDNAGPEYVVLPGNGNTTVTVTFKDTPPSSGEASIRKVDADDPTKGLAGAIIKITGMDNNFSGAFMTREGGYITDIPYSDLQTTS